MRLKKRLSAAVLCLIMVFTCLFVPLAANAEEITIVKATASSSASGKPPENILDGDVKTTWENLGSDTQPYVQLDLGSPVEFNKISMGVVFPLNVTGFEIIAADSEDMAEGAVTLAQGTQQSGESVYTFSAVRKRYIRYLITSFSGRIGLSEVQVSKVVPTEIVLLDTDLQIQIPESGSAAVPLPAYILRDETGEMIDTALYEADFSIDSAAGVSVDGENIVVTDQAQAAELTLSLSLPQVPGVTAQAALHLSETAVRETDRDYMIISATASSANGQHVANNMIDSNAGNRWQALSSDKAPVISFDLGTIRKFNKIKISHLNPQNVVSYTVEAADSEDMSAGLVKLAEGAASGATTEGIAFEAVEKRYVRYTFTQTSGGIAVTEFKVLNTVPASVDFDSALEPVLIPGSGKPDSVILLPGIIVKDAEGSILPGNYHFQCSVNAKGVSVSENQLTVSSEAEDQILIVRVGLADNPEVYGELSVQIYSEGFKPNETDKQIPIATVTATTNHASYPPTNIIDGILSTRWQPLSFDLLPRVTFDLGTAAEFNKIILNPTAAASVKEFILEAADDAGMTKNRVVLAEGTDIGDPAIFTFETVKRRYIRYSIPKMEGVPGILEFSVHYTVPKEISFTETIGDVVVPASGEGVRQMELPPVTVTDSGGDEIDPSNYSVVYTVSGLDGVSISGNYLQVDETAEEGVFTLKAHIDGWDEISAEMEIRTFVKENLLSGKPAEEEGAGSATQITDNDYATGIDLDGTKTFIIDAGSVVSINKIVVMLENAGQIQKLSVSGAQRPDFSDEALLYAQDSAEANEIKTNIPLSEARYLKLTVETKGPGARLVELEAYQVYPYALRPEVTQKTVYIPGFDPGTARIEPAVEISVLDKYGDPISGDDAKLVWSAPNGMVQGVSLNQETGELTIEPVASATTFTLRATSTFISSLYRDIQIDLKEEVEGEVTTDNMALGKTITSSNLHGSYPAKNAVDGNVATRMQFAGSAPYYLTIDLEEPRTFNTLTVNFQSSSGVIDPTVRASNNTGDLMDDESIIAVMQSPLRKVATVSMPTTTARYLMLYLPTAPGGCAILEIELRYLEHALIYVTAPESVTIGEETVVTDAPGIDIRDKNGVSMAISPEDYSFAAVSLPQGVTLNSDGSLSVAPQAQTGTATIRVTSTKKTSVYSEFTIEIRKASQEQPEETQKLEEIVNQFRLETYVSNGVATGDFSLPTQLDGAAIAYSVLDGEEALSIDENGGATVTRKTADVNVRLSVLFSLNGQEIRREYDMKVPAKTSGTSGGGSGSSGGRGSSSSGGGTGGTSGIPAGGMKPAETTEKFADIDELPWAKPYLQDLVSRNILNGSDGLLRPQASVTREEFVKMVVAAFLPQTQGGAVTFADVPEDSWCYPYVSAAVHAGVIQGLSQTEFGTGRAITREDAAVIVVRAVEKIRGSQTEGALSFADSYAISDYAKSAVAKLYAMGVVSGTDENQFMPKSEITRAEAAKIISILMQGGAK